MLHLKPLFHFTMQKRVQHQGNLDVTSDVVLSCCWCCPSAGADQNRNEGTFGCSPVPKTGTRVHSDVLWYQKQERGHLHKLKPPFYETALLFPLGGVVHASVPKRHTARIAEFAATTAAASGLATILLQKSQDFLPHRPHKKSPSRDFGA